MKRPLSEDFRGHFPEIVEEAYKNCKDQTIRTDKFVFPFVKIKSKLFGEKIVSLPFLDTTSFFGEYTENDILGAIAGLGENKKMNELVRRML